jgi:hypothetical protein
MNHFRSHKAAREAGFAIVPYAQRNLNSLLFTARLLKQREDPLPVDLQAALHERGINLSPI